MVTLSEFQNTMRGRFGYISLAAGTTYTGRYIAVIIVTDAVVQTLAAENSTTTALVGPTLKQGFVLTTSIKLTSGTAIAIPEHPSQL